MDGSIGHLLQRAARQHRARMGDALQDLGLFPGQEQVLVILLQEKSQTVGDLADSLKVRPPTVSKTLLRLAAQKLVERRDDADDARKSQVVLTAEGERRARELKSRMKSVEDVLLEALDGKDEKRLRKLLKRIAKSLATGDKAASETADAAVDGEED